LKALEEDREFRYALMGLIGFKEILDRITSLEEGFKKLYERQQRLEERFAKLEEMRETRRVVIVIAHRFGVLSGSRFREAMKYVVEDVLGVAKVERWTYRDVEGFVYGYPAVVEVDVAIRNGEHILIEVKSRVSKGDVAELSRIGKLYEKVVGVRPKLVIMGGFIDPDTYEAAAKLGVEIRPAFKDEYVI